MKRTHNPETTVESFNLVWRQKKQKFFSQKKQEKNNSFSEQGVTDNAAQIISFYAEKDGFWCATGKRLRMLPWGRCLVRFPILPTTCCVLVGKLHLSATACSLMDPVAHQTQNEKPNNTEIVLFVPEQRNLKSNNNAWESCLVYLNPIIAYFLRWMRSKTRVQEGEKIMG